MANNNGAFELGGRPPIVAHQQQPTNPYSNERLSDPIYQQLLTNETLYRDWLERTFRPIFDPYETQGGIPVSQLQIMFQRDTFGLPRHKLDKFLALMDRNLDGRVTYPEFYASMIRRRREDLNRGTRFFLSAILAISPNLIKEEKTRQKKEQRSEIHVDMVDGVQVVSDGKIEGEIPDSYLDAYNCKPPPLFIPLSCLAQIGVFVFYALEIQKRNSPTNLLSWTTGVPYWSPLIYDPRYRDQAWRFLSYMFIHQGYHHIIFNIFIQLFLGIPLEIVHKFWRVGPVFLGGVLAGSLASSMADHTKSLVGASGGCYALIGAHYALVIMNWEELQHDWLNCRKNPFSFIFSGVMRLIVLTLLLAADFGVALFQRYGLGTESQTSYAAHVGGLLAGILVGIPVLKNIEKKPWEAVIFWIALVIDIVLVTSAILWNIFFKEFPAPSK